MSWEKLFDVFPYGQGERLVLKRVTAEETNALRELVSDPEVYRYLPTFLFERRYPDMHRVIDGLYDECLQESLILGVCQDTDLCGLIELYDFHDDLHKVSIGYRLRRKYWGKGIATEAVGMMMRCLYTETDIKVITASTMRGNQTSAQVLLKNGFELVVHGAAEDWGYPVLTLADKWKRHLL